MLSQEAAPRPQLQLTLPRTAEVGFCRPRPPLPMGSSQMLESRAPRDARIPHLGAWRCCLGFAAWRWLAPVAEGELGGTLATHQSGCKCGWKVPVPAVEAVSIGKVCRCIYMGAGGGAEEEGGVEKGLVMLS